MESSYLREPRHSWHRPETGRKVSPPNPGFLVEARNDMTTVCALIIRLQVMRLCAFMPSPLCAFVPLLRAFVRASLLRLLFLAQTRNRKECIATQPWIPGRSQE